jgi:ADP-ribose pyrophosphatase
LEQVLGGEDVPLRPSEILHQQRQTSRNTASGGAAPPPVSSVPGSILPQPQDGKFFRLKPHLQSSLDQVEGKGGPSPPEGQGSDIAASDSHPRRVLFNLQGVTTSSVDDASEDEDSADASSLGAVSLARRRGASQPPPLSVAAADSPQPTYDPTAPEVGLSGSEPAPAPAPVTYSSWAQQDTSYAPVSYTTAEILDAGPAADPEDTSQLHFNARPSEDDLVDRVSCAGQYTVVEGFPHNPLGRTGYVGRGTLLRWGPNRTRFYAITRFARSPGNGRQALKTGKPLLEVLLLRQPSGEYTLPGGQTRDPGAFLRSLREEVAVWEERVKAAPESQRGGEFDAALPLSEDGGPAAGSADELLQSVGARPPPYVATQAIRPDARNTDNAWIEAAIVNHHDSGTLLHVLPPIIELPAKACTATKDGRMPEEERAVLQWVVLYSRLPMSPSADLSPLSQIATYRVSYFGPAEPLLKDGSFCLHTLWRQVSDVHTTFGFAISPTRTMAESPDGEKSSVSEIATHLLSRHERGGNGGAADSDDDASPSEDAHAAAMAIREAAKAAAAAKALAAQKEAEANQNTGERGGWAHFGVSHVWPGFDCFADAPASSFFTHRAIRPTMEIGGGRTEAETAGGKITQGAPQGCAGRSIAAARQADWFVE